MPIPIDPALVPAPAPSKSTPIATGPAAIAAKLKGRALPAEKVAGRKRGRPAGSPNFAQDDIEMLLILVEEHLPTGQIGWSRVHAEFNEFALFESRPQRSVDSLKNKFMNVSNHLSTAKTYSDSNHSGTRLLSRLVMVFAHLKC